MFCIKSSLSDTYILIGIWDCVYSLLSDAETLKAMSRPNDNDNKNFFLNTSETFKFSTNLTQIQFQIQI